MIDRRIRSALAVSAVMVGAGQWAWAAPSMPGVSAGSATETSVDPAAEEAAALPPGPSVAAPGEAAAVSPAEAPGVPEVALPPASAQPVPASPEPSPEPSLSSAVEEAGQQARIAARKVELLEEQMAAKSKEPAPSVTADEKGFAIRSGDGAYVLRIRGLLQADSRWFVNDGALSDRADTFLIRRFRPTLEGTLAGLADFRLTPDFAGGTVAVFDAYADLHPTPWLRLRAGKFKSPLGLERLQADADTPFPERALTQYLTPTRDVGAALWGDVAGGVLVYSAGIYNGSPDNANQDIDANHAKDFVFRVLLQPFKAEGFESLGALGVHIAVSTGNRFGTPTNPQLPSFRSAGLNTFFTYLAPGAGTAADSTGSGTPFAHLRQTRLNPGLYYYCGPLGFLGEVVQSSQVVQKGNVTATLTHRAAHATLSLVIGGKNGYDGATPTAPYNPAKGNWGAIELAARWNYLKLSEATFGDPNDAAAPVFADPLKSASKAQGWAGAVTLVPSRTVRVGVALEQTYFTGGLAAADKKTVANRNIENVFFGRVQLNF